MKEYKVDSLFYDKSALDYVSTQSELNKYARKGWRLVSTDTIDFETRIRIHLYFERDVVS